jgi:hypothetical protein
MQLIKTSDEDGSKIPAFTKGAGSGKMYNLKIIITAAIISFALSRLQLPLQQ